MTASESNAAADQALEPLLSIEQVSEFLGISQSGIFRLLRSEELACVKVGGRTLIEPAEVRKFIAARRRAAAALDETPVAANGEAA